MPRKQKTKQKIEMRTSAEREIPAMVKAKPFEDLYEPLHLSRFIQIVPNYSKVPTAMTRVRRTMICYTRSAGY
jgi:hypothetical protein